MVPQQTSGVYPGESQNNLFISITVGISETVLKYILLIEVVFGSLKLP